MKLLVQCGCSDRMRSWGLLILRVIVGVVFFAHGYQKLGMGAEQIAGFFGSVGIPAALFFAYVVTYLELIGGILLIVGLFTHWLGKLFALEMIIAAALVHGGNGLFVSDGGFEFVAVLFGAAVVFMTLGPGALALDTVLRRKCGCSPHDEK